MNAKQVAITAQAQQCIVFRMLSVVDCGRLSKAHAEELQSQLYGWTFVQLWTSGNFCTYMCVVVFVFENTIIVCRCCCCCISFIIFPPEWEQSEPTRHEV